MNESIYDAGTITWAIQRSREALDIPRHRAKIDHLKQLLSFIGDWCKRGEFDEEQTEYCKEKFTQLFNKKSLKVGKEKAYAEAIRIFINFYDNLGYFEYRTKIIMSYLIRMAKQDVKKIDQGILLQKLIKENFPLEKVFKDGYEH